MNVTSKKPRKIEIQVPHTLMFIPNNYITKKACNVIPSGLQ